MGKGNTVDQLKRVLEFCTTERQKQVVQAVIDCKGSTHKASKIIEPSLAQTNISRMIKNIKKRMAKAGYGSHYIADNHIPDGFAVKGTSTLYKDGEPSIQWVKTDREAADKIQALQDAVQHIVSEVDGKAKPVKKPNFTNDNTMTVYNIGDAHIGMLAHKSESGDNFNIDIAENDLVEAMDRLVKASPPTETAVIIDVGDFFHADNQQNETTASKNKLDVDGRWFKVLRVGLMVMVKLVEKALTKHKNVIVKNIIGNHNEHSAIYLSTFLSAWFRDEPRVTIDQSPSLFWYHQFGKVLIGSTHGHTVKPQDLGEIMACDCEDIWSSTKYRYWYTGHVHHDQVKEYRTYKFESFRTLAAKDAWHAGSGYRSGRDMKCIVHHKEYGEVQRHTVNVNMLKGK